MIFQYQIQFLGPLGYYKNYSRKNQEKSICIDLYDFEMYGLLSS